MSPMSSARFSIVMIMIMMMTRTMKSGGTSSACHAGENDRSVVLPNLANPSIPHRQINFWRTNGGGESVP